MQRFFLPNRGKNAIPEVGKPAPVNRLFQALPGTISATGAGDFSGANHAIILPGPASVATCH